MLLDIRLFVWLCFQEADHGAERLRGQSREADGAAAEGHEGAGVHLQVHRPLSSPLQSVSPYTYLKSICNHKELMCACGILNTLCVCVSVHEE